MYMDEYSHMLIQVYPISIRHYTLKFQSQYIAKEALIKYRKNFPSDLWKFLTQIYGKKTVYFWCSRPRF
jgi:hypothetical protein